MKLFKVLIFIILNMFFLVKTEAKGFYSTYPNLIKEGELVSENDYNKIKIKPYFPDSEVYYYKESNSYYELKVLPNGIIMIRDPETGIANFGLADLDDFSTQSWQSLCMKDKITDDITCMITSDSITIMHKNGIQMISSVKTINDLDFNRKQYVRIDENTAISAYGIIEKQKYNEIVGQMNNGRIVKTRYYDTNGIEHNNESSLDGFNNAYQYLMKFKTELKK